MHTTQTVKSSLLQLPHSIQTHTMAATHFCFKTYVSPFFVTLDMLLYHSFTDRSLKYRIIVFNI